MQRTPRRVKVSDLCGSRVSGTASPLTTKGEHENLPSLDAVPGRRKKWRPQMYTGNLIDDLLEKVELAEARANEYSREQKLAYWYAVAQQELAQFDSSLAGAA
jgi:hypothetical protein